MRLRRNCSYLDRKTFRDKKLMNKNSLVSSYALSRRQGRVPGDKIDHYGGYHENRFQDVAGFPAT